MKRRIALELVLGGLLAVLFAMFETGSARAQTISNPVVQETPASSPPASENNSKPGKGDAKKDARSGVAPVTAEADTTYRIGVEDELQISVWREPELSTVVVVRPDGKITLPLLNEVTVTGLKTDELQVLLAEKFRPFINEPQITVIVRTIRSRKVYLVGQAARQGSYPLNGSKTVLELIAEAGGLGPFAKSGGIYVLRTVNGSKVRIPVNYKKALSGQSENVALMPGDVVVVP